MQEYSRAQLEDLVDRATVDCYDDDEAITGLYSMIADNLGTPFSTSVLGVDVTVESVELRGRYDIVAVCRRGTIRQAVPILDLPLPDPPPSGIEWIEAYRHWAG